MGRPVTDMDLICRNAEKVAGKLAADNRITVIRFLKNPDGPCFRLVNRLDTDDHIDISELRDGSITADLARRDFTINAMARPVYPGRRLGKVIDPFGGVDDIGKKRIRVTGPTVFTDDPLRMLRAVRFCAELGFTLSGETTDRIRRDAPLISGISGERIWAELKRILQSNHSHGYIRQMDQLALLTGIFPEITDMKACPQNAHHHLDVWPHSLAVLANCEAMINDPAHRFGQSAELIETHLARNNRKVLLKLTALLHDVGKPSTRGYDDTTGRITFYGHDKAGADIVADIAHQLRLSGTERNYLVSLVAEHLHILSLAMPEVKPSPRMRLFRKLKNDAISLIILGMADVLATQGPQSSREYRDAYLAWADTTLASFDESIRPRLSPASEPIRGKDLITLGMSPGPDIGRILSQIRRAWDDGHIHDHAAAMAMARKLMKEKPHAK
jgi:putative nucleotidyltransferase with HDIG domain